MQIKLLFLDEWGKAMTTVLPKKAIPQLRRYLLKAGIEYVPYKFFGALFYLTALLTIAVYLPIIYPFIYQKFIEMPILFVLSAVLGWFITQMFFAIVFTLIVYFYIDLKIYGRTRKMEELLPDFLQGVSSNLKAGLPFERALWSAIKPRFSVLAKEMAEASKKVMTGYEVDKALLEFSDKYDSPTLKRSIELIISGIESGGNAADLIDQVVYTLKRTKSLKDDMAASAITYVIFIGVIVIVIAPILFALSFNLLMVIIGFASSLSNVTASISSISIFTLSEDSINLKDFEMFSVLSITIIAIFSSMITSIVEKGSIKAGLKYIPLFLGGSLVFYFVFLNLLRSIFSGVV